jgi:hypothetical protein
MFTNQEAEYLLNLKSFSKPYQTIDLKTKRIG